MASRHVGTLNVLSLGVGLFSGIWLAQNHADRVPNLKEELRRLAAATSHEDEETDHSPARWTRGAVPLDEAIVGTELKGALTQLRERRRTLEATDMQVSQLFAHSEETRARLHETLGKLEEQKEAAKASHKEARGTLIARMKELKLERRDKDADKERIEYYLNALRELRDQEIGTPPTR
jgi:ribosomal protein L16 Arg81 hydroxylase